MTSKRLAEWTLALSQSSYCCVHRPRASSHRAHRLHITEVNTHITEVNTHRRRSESRAGSTGSGVVGRQRLPADVRRPGILRTRLSSDLCAVRRVHLPRGRVGLDIDDDRVPVRAVALPAVHPAREGGGRGPDGHRAARDVLQPEPGPGRVPVHVHVPAARARAGRDRGHRAQDQPQPVRRRRCSARWRRRRWDGPGSGTDGEGGGGVESASIRRELHVADRPR
ncbi:hypothetical protein OH76DRAFT_646550 [Lentinus brumalis]|uniref:Uncharacterized protein n=1 Tax=Lentinus brumalis TaxID=2498619 RepID=A0A371D7Y5_9APHY|nr:hypothetical protein OH76DRAFT_646550 [Polyporus brumalis]